MVEIIVCRGIILPGFPHGVRLEETALFVHSAPPRLFPGVLEEFVFGAMAMVLRACDTEGILLKGAGPRVWKSVLGGAWWQVPLRARRSGEEGFPFVFAPACPRRIVPRDFWAMWKVEAFQLKGTILGCMIWDGLIDQSRAPK